MKFLKALLRLLCLVLVAAIVLAAVFLRPNSAVVLKEGETVYDEDVPFKAGGDFTKAASSGFIELYFNSSNASVAVKETSLNKMWYSSQRPDDTDVSLTLNGGEYVFTSNQSVKYNNFTSELTDDGVSVEYTMTDKPEGGGDVVFKVSVDYTLKDGNLFVSADVENGSPLNAAVTSFSVLPRFGSFSSAGKDDYIVLPDGCGAAVYPYYAKKPADYSCRVYSGDFSYEKEDCAGALFGAFGIKTGDSAFAAIINKGEEYAAIKSHCAKDSASSVSADFCFDGIYSKDGRRYTHYGAQRSAEICYKFLSSENAAYSEIALSCREQFIRSGLLPAAFIKSDETLPMFLTVNGAYKASPYSLGYEKFTTFAQALDIVKRVKSKGVDNISLRYKNALALNSASTPSALGGKKDLKELTDYTSSMNVPIYFDANILTFTSHFGDYTLYGAKQADKIPYNINTNQDADGLDGVDFKLRFRTLDGTGRFVSQLIDKSADYGITGICVNDAGRYLCSDFSHKPATRTLAKEYISAQFPAMQNIGGVSVENGNIYTVKNSSAVVDIPMSVYYETSDSYRSIPFVQTVYHGITVLSGPPINTADDIHAQSLRCIEYGVCPCFSTVFSGSDNGTVVFKTASEIIINEYNFMLDALKGLEGERITDHSMIKENLFCTTYGNKTRIYVNYSKSKAVINGLTVQGRSCLRIDG